MLEKFIEHSIFKWTTYESLFWWSDFSIESIFKRTLTANRVNKCEFSHETLYWQACKQQKNKSFSALSERIMQITVSLGKCDFKIFTQGKTNSSQFCFLNSRLHFVRMWKYQLHFGWFRYKKNMIVSIWLSWAIANARPIIVL